MDCPIICFWHSERVYISSKGFYVFSFYHVVYVVTSCFLFSFYSPYVILLRIVLLIPKVSHGKPELPTTAILILSQLKPIGSLSSIVSGKEESGLVGVWNLEPLASGGQSGPKLFPHVICLFLYAWEKNSEQDLFCRGSSANLHRLHTCENKVPFWDFSRFAVTRAIGEHSNHYANVRSRVVYWLRLLLIPDCVDEFVIYIQSSMSHSCATPE